MEKKTNIEPKPITPPYLSVARLDQVIELVSNRNLTEITTAQFTDRGFNNSDASYAVSTLKFLGLADDKGIATPAMAGLRLQGDARTKQFEKIVREGYKKLFASVEAPQNLSNDDLANEFYAQYKDKVTPRIVRTAIPVFIKLCEYAGLKEKGSVVSKKHTKQKERITKNNPGKTNLSHPPIQIGNNGETLASVTVADGRMILNMPNSLKERLLDDEKLEDDWRSVRSALRAFADKYIPKELTEFENEEKDR